MILSICLSFWWVNGQDERNTTLLQVDHIQYSSIISVRENVDILYHSGEGIGSILISGLVDSSSLKGELIEATESILAELGALLGLNGS